MNRYHYKQQRKPGYRMDGPRRSSRWQGIVIALLLAALIGTLIYCLPRLSYASDARALYVARLQTECDSAISYSKYLSRTASSNSNVQLAMIRSCLYAMDVINQSYHALDAGNAYLIATSLLSDLYTTVDSYYQRLMTGSSTTEALATLTSQLEYLQAAVLSIR